jgi:hypothetical protein
VLLGVPNANRELEARALWQELRATAVPFPFECSDTDPIVASEHTGCDIEMPEQADAIASLRPRLNTARICFSERLFTKPRDVQLGILLHEAVHIRLHSGRLQKNFLASQDVANRERARETFENEDDAKFALVRKTCAYRLLNLVTEVGVDKFMACQHPWVSADYWGTRCRAFYINAPLIADQDVTTSLRSYAAFHRLVALELGLTIIKMDPCREQLLAQRDDYVAALVATCDDETAGLFERSGVKLLAFDPIPTVHDDDAYDELCERVLALTA